MHGQKTDRKPVATAVSIFRSIRGFTLVEVSITVVIATIGIFGMAALFSDMAKIQRKASSTQAVGQMREAIIKTVTSNTSVGTDNAWLRSINDATAATGNPLLGCLRDNTACAINSPRLLNLKNVDGTELFYSRTLSRGFNFDGVLCNTFSIVTPDLACPFSWTITAEAQCVGANKTSCVNPVVEVRGVLQYAPGADDPLAGGFNTKNFEILVRRGDKKDRNEPIQISYTLATAVATPEAGTCYNTWVARKFNTIQSDPAGNAALALPDAFTLTPGSYECRVQVPAFKNGANQINFKVGTDDHFSSTVHASLQGESVTITMQANFNVTTTTPVTVQVLHHCTQQPSMGPPGGDTTNTYILGVPVPGAGGAYNVGYSFSVVSCVKTSG